METIVRVISGFEPNAIAPLLRRLVQARWHELSIQHITCPYPRPSTRTKNMTNWIQHSILIRRFTHFERSPSPCYWLFWYFHWSSSLAHTSTLIVIRRLRLECGWLNIVHRRTSRVSNAVPTEMTNQLDSLLLHSSVTLPDGIFCHWMWHHQPLFHFVSFREKDKVCEWIRKMGSPVVILRIEIKTKQANTSNIRLSIGWGKRQREEINQR